MDGVHVFPLRVYFEDTDAGGVVYHASYLRFAERARTEMLRSLGVPHQELIEAHGLMFVVSRLEADYLAPARLDDRLEVRTALAAVGGASVRVLQDVFALRGGASVACARLTVRLACIDRQGRPARLPPALAEKTRLAASPNRN